MQNDVSSNPGDPTGAAGADAPGLQRQRKRPSFHLETEPSDDEDDPVPRPSRQVSTSSQLTSEDVILNFCSQSLQSYSYSELAKSSVANRIQALKKSLEFLRDHPAQLKQIEDSLVSYATHNRKVLERVLGSNDSDDSTTVVQNGTGTSGAEPLDKLSDLLQVLETACDGGTLDLGGPVVRRQSRIFSRRQPPLDRATSSSFLVTQPPPPPPPPQLAHNRVMSNMPSMQSEFQILEALSIPYVDVAWTSLIQRTSSVTSFPMMMHSGSVVNLPSIASTLNLSGYSSAGSGGGVGVHPTPASAGGWVEKAPSTLAQRRSSRQCIFTTRAQKPFKILSLNDIACLVYGVSQADMRTRSMLDLIPESAHESLLKQLSEESQSPDGTRVMLCGSLVPILKPNGTVNLASYWVKTHASKEFMVWVIEQVVSDVAEIKWDNDGVVTEVKNGSNCKLFTGLDSANVGITFTPSLKTHSQYHTMSSDSRNIPCIVSGDINGDKVARVESLPYMAGAVVLSRQDLAIESFNSSFMKTLFGYDEQELKKKPVDTLIPKFSEYLAKVRNSVFGGKDDVLTAGLVIPEHMFRRVSVQRQEEGGERNGERNDGGDDEGDAEYARFLDSTGIPAIASNGQAIIVDVQLRVLSSDYLALWITFFRDDEAHAESQLPSQLKLFMQKRRQLHQSSPSFSSTISSDSSSDDITSVASADTSLSTAEARKHITEVGAMRRTKKISDFEILHPMGEGAYGKVSLAKYKLEPPYVVVIKSVIKERILVDTWTRDRKLGTVPNEIKVMATLAHPNPHANIICLLDFFEDDDFYHIEMERHGEPGIDLFDLIELRPSMSESECRSIFAQIVSAVAYLHAHGIVHRDIKDENIVVDERDGRVKLIDFGSSAFVKQGPFDVFVGTIDYAAPEVLGGRPYSGKPQDIWALGILLYTLIYKENPFYNVDEIMDGELRIPFRPSHHCLDLIKLILRRDVGKRPSIEDIQAHPWFQRA